jgi:hypothetical protein
MDVRRVPVASKVSPLKLTVPCWSFFSGIALNKMSDRQLARLSRVKGDNGVYQMPASEQRLADSISVWGRRRIILRGGRSGRKPSSAKDPSWPVAAIRAE